MSDGEQPETDREGKSGSMMAEIEAQERRMIRERSRGERSIWFGLGMMGMIGWSVVLPALAGVVVGAWLDLRFPGGLPWTLVLLLLGIGLGSLSAWRWVSEEQAVIEKEKAGLGKRITGAGDDDE